jgi:hypothetical protein
MDLADGTLASVLKEGPMTVGDSLAVLAATLEGLVYLHGVGCIHRDIKPDNILVFKGQGYVLGDLGIVHWSDMNPAFTSAATITRASVATSDIYALGVTWYEVLTGGTLDPQEVGAKQYVRWLKVPPPEFNFLTFAEAVRLVDGADAEWRAMILLALRTGLRQGELLGLKWDDVDLVAGRLTVRRSAVRGVVGTPKNGKSREVPLSDDAIAIVRSLPSRFPRENVFAHEDGRMLTKGDCKHPLSRACRKTGLRRIGWRVMRQSFALHGRVVALPAIAGRVTVFQGVEAPGIESPATSSAIVANGRAEDANCATRDDERRLEVSASPAGPAGTPASASVLDPDEALRLAIVAAVYAGDTVRARALLDVLDAKPATAPVLTLKPRRVSCDIDSRDRAEAPPGSTDPNRQMRYKE